MLEEELGEDHSHLWELKLNKENIKVYIKKGGSEFNKEMPYIRTEIVFSSHMPMKKIVKAVSDHFVIVSSWTRSTGSSGTRISLRMRTTRPPTKMGFIATSSTKHP